MGRAASAKGTSTARLLAVAVMAACGGGQDRSSSVPVAASAGAASEEARTGEDELIPPEKLDEIRAQFDRKRDMVSRCYPQAIAAGQLARNARGYVTVGLSIQPDGSPRDVKVLEATLSSPVLADCVLGHVRRWTFATLPRALDYSYTYSFESD